MSKRKKNPYLNVVLSLISSSWSQFDAATVVMYNIVLLFIIFKWWLLWSELVNGAPNDPYSVN